MRADRTGPSLTLVVSTVEDLLADKGIEDVELRASSTFGQLGLTSLDLVEVFVSLEEALGVPLDPAGAEGARCLADLTNLAPAAGPDGDPPPIPIR